MYWAKHYFASLREIDSQSIHACKHMLAIIACIICKEINLWLRYGWCGLEDGLLLLLVLDAVMTTLVAYPSPPWSCPGFPALLLLGQLLVACLLLLVKDCSALPWSSASMIQSMEYIGWYSSVSWCCVRTVCSLCVECELLLLVKLI
jgi:hypothetical protein